MKCGHTWVQNLINNVFGLQLTQQQEKLLECMLAIALVNQQNSYGNLYRQFIVNVQFVTLTFEMLMNKFYPINDIKR
ncbi:hypothetical protein BCD64_24975 [Nostoc sp. MBR 210]|nr:hypothetical protein BCD64_24975 [Nostoc sp. MBR 210]